MMTKSTATISARQPSAALGPLIISYAIFMSLGFGLPIASTFYQDDFWGNVLAFVAAFVIGTTFTSLFFIKCVSAAKIAIQSGFITIRQAIGREYQIPMENVTKVTNYFLDGTFVIVSYVLGGKNRFFMLGSGTLVEIETGERCIGEVLEAILESATNLNKFTIEKKIDSITLGRSFWAKEPNWTIINMAIHRANENQKKLQRIKIKR